MIYSEHALYFSHLHTVGLPPMKSENKLTFPTPTRQPRWLSGLRRGLVHTLMIARQSINPENLGSNPGQGSKGINFSGWHCLDMSVTVTKRR